MGELGNAAVATLALPAVQGLLILILLVGLFVWHRKRDTPIDLMDLVLDRGHLSSRKLFETGAFVLTSIWFMGRVLSGGADAADALTYAGLWTVARTAGQMVHARAEQNIRTADTARGSQEPAGGANDRDA
jgi:hypothetical protein